MRRRTLLQSLGALGAAAGCRKVVPEPLPAPAPAPPRDPFTDPAIAPVADAALQAATEAGASYADVRISAHRTQSIRTREARVTAVADDQHRGLGVRVVVDGTWGFAASATVTPDEAAAVARRAVALARANRALQKEPVRLHPVEPQVGAWQTPIRRDPFEVPLEEKVERLLSINRTALEVPGVAFCTSSMQFVRELKRFASTDGTRVEQVLYRCDPSFQVTSVDAKRGSFRTRDALSAPQGLGYEYVEDYPWDEDVRAAAADAVAMHTAPSIEPGTYDLVLRPSNLWLTIHESIGHPTELDRALGLEANFAGTSFLTTDKLGRFRVASPIVTFRAERTTPGALATARWDDDGVPTTEWDLVRDGVFVGYQTTRDQAHWIGEERGRACAYAQSWRDVAFQRMPNVNLEPGPDGTTLDDLIAGVERGILIAGRGSYSIDHQRYNFQFGGQTFHRIEGGRVTGLVNDVAYQSNTAAFWQACDALGDRSTYEVNGSFYDGKGEPGQVNAVSHGCPAARFRGIQVLNSGRTA